MGNVFDVGGVLLDTSSDFGRIASNTATNYSAFKAITEEDPEKRELFNNRVLCTNKFQWQKLKTSFLAFILPILLIFVFVFVGQYYSPITNYIPWLFIWIFSGGIYLTYLNSFGWNYRQYEINMAKKLDPETCKPK